MAKWETAPVIEQPKWMTAPVVAPAPIQPQPRAGMSPLNSFTGVDMLGTGYGNASDVKAKELLRPKAMIDLASESGMPIGRVLAGYEAIDADPEAWGVGTEDDARRIVAAKARLEGKRTFGEELREDALIDALSILPFSPLHDWEKKGYAEAKRRLRESDYSTKYQMTPMGGYAMVQAPIDREALLGVVRDYELEQARGTTTAAKVGKGVAALPGYAGEFAVGGELMSALGLVGTLPAKAPAVVRLAKTVGNALTRSGVTTAIQPHRVTSALVDYEMQGETGMMAVAKAYGSVYIENLTELTGEAFSTVGSAVLKQLPFGGKMLAAFQREAAKLGIDEASFMGRIAKQGGWNGILSEFGEERVNTILSGVFALDDFGTGPDSKIRDRIAAGLKQDMEAENLLVESLILLTPGGVKLAAKQASKLFPASPEMQGVMNALEEAVDADQQAQRAETAAGADASGQGARDATVSETPAADAIPNAAPADAYEYQAVVNRLQESIVTAKKIAPRIVSEQSEERSKRVGAAQGTLESLLKKGVPAREAVQRSTAMLKGQLTSYEHRYDPIREEIGNETVELLHRNIATDPKLKYFEKDKIQETLDKLLDGSALTMHQARVLGDYFGRGIGKAAVQRVPMEEKFWSTILEVLNIPRTALASLDVSGILRQGRALGSANPKEYAQMSLRALQAFWSEKSAIRIENEYKNDPSYQDARDAELEMPEWGRIDVGIEELSERFMAARLLQKIPGVRASERSFVTALNWLRMTVFNKVIAQTESQYGRPMTLDERKQLASAINNLSGRSKLPSALKNIAPIMNAAFFSPRFVASRFMLPKDVTMGMARSVGAGELVEDADGNLTIQDKAHLTPELAMSIKGIAGMTATNIALMMLIKSLTRPDDDVEMEPDPRSTDFGNIRVGNTHIDLWAGYSKAARFLVRFATGQVKTATGEIREQDRGDILRSFIQSKESPLASLLHDWWFGQNMIGRPIFAAPKGSYGKFLDDAGIPDKVQGVGSELWNRLVPMLAQDVTDALILEGVPQALVVGPLSFLGAGVQTYEKSLWQTATETKDMLAQRDYGKIWNDLTVSQQKDLRDREQAIADAEREAKKDSYAMTRIDRTEEVSAGERIFDLLSKPVQDALETAGVRTELSRTIKGDVWLNRQRWIAYQDLAAKAIDSAVSELMEVLPGYSESEKAEAIKRTVSRAKGLAANQITQDIEDGKL